MRAISHAGSLCLQPSQQAYQEQRINLGKAAELLDLAEVELRRRFVDLGIPLCLGSADMEEAQAEVNALRAWYHRDEPKQS